MWLYLIAAFLLVVGVIGGILSGGIFTIVVLPLGVIVLLAALAAGMWARGAGASAHGGKSEIEPRPLPHTNRPQPGTHGIEVPAGEETARVLGYRETPA
jgi:hypothetical protein